MPRAIPGPAVPSLKLLQFLRAQSKALPAFLEPNQTNCPAALRGPPTTTPCCHRPGVLPRSSQQPCAAAFKAFGGCRIARARSPATARHMATAAAAGASHPLCDLHDGRWRGTRSMAMHAAMFNAPVWAFGRPWKLLKKWSLFKRQPIPVIRPLQPNDLDAAAAAAAVAAAGPDEQSGENSPPRTPKAKASMDPSLRCTEIGENGQVLVQDGQFKKSELIAKYRLLPRDLRKIDSSNLPLILVRESAILLNLLHLKVLIKHDRALLFVFGSQASRPQSIFLRDLQAKLKQQQAEGAGDMMQKLPYELRALEAVLQSVTTELEAEYAAVRDPVILVLSELEEDIDREKLQKLLVLSKRVSTFEQRAKLVRDAIEELLEADNDMADMYLTEKAHKVHRVNEDHTEVEMLLESYNKICDEVYQEANNLSTGIRSTEEILRAILDQNRNTLMLMDLRISIGTLGLAVGTFMAGLLGMNLEIPFGLGSSPWAFGGITGCAFALSILAIVYGHKALKKVIRLRVGGGRLRGAIPWADSAGCATDAWLGSRDQSMRAMAAYRMKTAATHMQQQMQQMEDMQQMQQMQQQQQQDQIMQKQAAKRAARTAPAPAVGIEGQGLGPRRGEGQQGRPADSMRPVTAARFFRRGEGGGGSRRA